MCVGARAFVCVICLGIYRFNECRSRGLAKEFTSKQQKTRDVGCERKVVFCFAKDLRTARRLNAEPMHQPSAIWVGSGIRVGRLGAPSTSPQSILCVPPLLCKPLTQQRGAWCFSALAPQLPCLEHESCSFPHTKKNVECPDKTYSHY